MIKTNDVLTATAVVLEKVPDSFKLSENVNPIITGLNTSCITATGYTLDNIATKLPEEVKDKSEHTELVDTTATAVATVIRDSLSLIRTHVIPACDMVEKSIKSIGKVESTIELALNKLLLRYSYIPNSFFTSPIFPDGYDDQYQRGVQFTTDNIKRLGQWPEKTYEDILAYISASKNYPELHFAIQDKTAVEDAWKTLGGNNYWLQLTADTVDPNQIDVGPSKLKTLVVLSLIVNKLVNEDDAFPGVLGIGLNEYRAKLLRVRGFLNTLLYITKQRYKNSMPDGLMLSETDVKFEQCDVKDSQFYGAMVLSGYVNVTYNDTVADFFSNSEEYSLSTTVIGLLYARSIKQVIPGDTLTERLKDYQEAEKAYISSLQPFVLRNTRASVGNKVKDALYQIANGDWKEVLVNLNNGNDKNVAYTLERLVDIDGSFMRYLLSPSVVDRIRDEKLKIANTPIAVMFSNALKAPIASEILSDNVNETQLTPEQQRKVLGKAIANAVIRRLLKPM